MCYYGWSSVLFATLSGIYVPILTVILHKVRDKFWWDNWKSDIRQRVLKCPHCAIQRLQRPDKQRLLRFSHPDRRFQCVTLDIMQVSPTSKEGNKKVIVMGDLFSRYVWVVPVKYESAKTIAGVILQEWILRFGPPKRLLTDRAKAFMGNIVQEILCLLGVRKIFTRSYHPQTDGFLDRFKRTLMRDIRAFVNLQNDDWDRHIPAICFKYNTTVHSATNMTPFRAMFGQDAFDFDTELGKQKLRDIDKLSHQ